MDPVIQGDNTIIFGSDGVYSAAGYVISGRNRLTGEKLTVDSNTGYAKAAIFFGDMREGEVEFIMQTSITLPVRGDQATLFGLADFLVDDIEEMWANKDVKKVRMTATKYLDMTIA